MLKIIFWFQVFFMFWSFCFVLFSFEYTTYLQSLKCRSISNVYDYFSNRALSSSYGVQTRPVALASIICKNSRIFLIHFLCLKERIGVQPSDDL